MLFFTRLLRGMLAWTSTTGAGACLELHPDIANIAMIKQLFVIIFMQFPIMAK